MAKDQTKRIAPSVLKADKDAYAALLKINGYAPAKTEYSTANATTAFEAMEDLQRKETQAEVAYAAARDDATAAEWDFHNFMLNVKKQGVAQFGENSNEVQSLGLKKKSEYKRPGRNGKRQPAAAH